MSSLKCFILRTALLPALRLAAGQTIQPDGLTDPANEPTVAPAVERVDTNESNSTAELFEHETWQLTDAVITNLTELGLTDIPLFAFQDESHPESLVKRTFGKCKTYPGDRLWPSESQWKLFNDLLGGGLVETVPYAAPCYADFDTYDQSKCDFITNNWANGSIYHSEDPTSVNAVLFQGLTCMPPTLIPSASSCTVGGYPAYAVKASNVSQIQLAVNVARNSNLRLVVKNTGHDFSAKSTGMGALSIWTHNLKDIRFFESYSQGSYAGLAFKVGAGVQAFELYEAAREHGVTAVGGEGRTVGVMGGYILGGGHSPLSSLYGMGADQVLSMEVVTADGRFVTASDTSNPDLFWALRGGGGSTFGVVTSVVVKAYPKIGVTTLTYVLATSNTTTADQFWAALRAYFDGFIIYTDAGNYEYFRIQNLGDGQYSSDMGPWFAPGMSKPELESLVEPLFARFRELGVEIDPVYQEYDDFYDAWYASFPVEPWGSNAIRQASRLFPKSNWEDAGKLNETFDAIRGVVEEGGYVIAFNIAAAPKTGYPDNAVNPAWRNTVMHAIVANLWDPTLPAADTEAASNKLTFDWMQRWRDVSPGAGSYMSEADYIEPNFTQSFFGSNYGKLYQLKQRLDPFGVLYAYTGVGSEDWEMSEMIMGNLPSQNSRLCRV